MNREISDKGYPRAGSLGQLLEKFIAASVKVSGPIESVPGKPRVIALIGPTGVGKTTNLVKLASQYSLLHQLKVALLTADTYRIGAVEQLRIYRDIIDIPFEAVNSPEDLKEALKRHADRDLIFFDTAGRSPQNKKQLQELRAFLEAAEPSEVHLVISATTKNEDLLPIVGKFGLVPINRFLLTKLDETRSHGLILNLASNFSIPISYLSNGQNVPNDIEIATPERLAELVAGGEPWVTRQRSSGRLASQIKAAGPRTKQAAQPAPKPIKATFSRSRPGLSRSAAARAASGRPTFRSTWP